MEWALKHVEAPGDRAIRMAHESAKSFVHESWQLSSQVTTTASLMALRFLNEPSVQRHGMQHRIRPVVPDTEPEAESPFAAVLACKEGEEADVPLPLRARPGKYEWHRAPPRHGAAGETRHRSDETLEEAEVAARAEREQSVASKVSRMRRRSQSMRDVRSLEGELEEAEGIAFGSTMGRSNSDNHLPAVSVPMAADLLSAPVDVVDEEHAATGLMEDIHLAMLQMIDWSAETLLWMWHGVFGVLVSFSVFSLLSFSVLVAPFRMVRDLYRWLVQLLRQIWAVVVHVATDPAEALSSGMDGRSKEEVVTHAGYPYECHDVLCEDGAILQLERLPNKDSRRVVYFQHGIIDSSFTWVAGGAPSSLAMMAFDQGYDVFLGNFRGNEPVRHAKENISAKEYWNFNVNHHAFLDMKAFVECMRRLKCEELGVELIPDCTFVPGPPNDDGEEELEQHDGSEQPAAAPRLHPLRKTVHQPFTISVIAHSMGGMATLMYLVKCGLDRVDHGISRAVLLAPAGNHMDSPWIARYVPPVLDKLLYCMPFVNSLGFPSAVVRSLVAKVFQDVKSTNPTRDLFTYFATKLIGGEIENHSLTKVHNLVRWVFAGTPVGVFRHFYQLIRTKRFTAYDYGKKGNLREYGTEEPILFTDHYDQINIPVFFLMGLKDNLVRPANIIAHYATLSNTRPSLAFLKAFADASHVDFTIGANSRIIAEILQALVTDVQGGDEPRVTAFAAST